MAKSRALSVAIDLMRTPSRVWALRSAPLPSGVDVLLQIAAGDDKAVVRAAEMTGRSAETVRNAATFFIEQILFYSEADSYRTLGVNPGVSTSELRHNMALLVRWLHPDKEGQGTRSLYATNVTNAWNDLKTEERRAIYDTKQAEIKKITRLSRKRRRRPQAHPYPVHDFESTRSFTSRVWSLIFSRP